MILKVIDKQWSFLKEFQEDESFRVMYKSQERKWGKNVSGVGGGKPYLTDRIVRVIVCGYFITLHFLSQFLWKIRSQNLQTIKNRRGKNSKRISTLFLRVQVAESTHPPTPLLIMDSPILGLTLVKVSRLYWCHMRFSWSLLTPGSASLPGHSNSFKHLLKICFQTSLF